MQSIRKPCVWTLALMLFAITPGAGAMRLSDVAVRYTQINDADFVDIASFTLSFATASNPWLLTLLGEDVRYDFTLGRFSNGKDSGGGATFVYAGPSWLYHPQFLWHGSFAEFGTAIGYLSDQFVGDKDLGGHLQFTTHATLGQELGARQQWRIGLRLQHTSNAGLESPNPGLDSALIDLAYRF